ncbi:MAG: DMT family transporter [Lachnospiraceae bacterium]|nr:DMT family transporter [Lachnospiraceae bacterium]
MHRENTIGHACALLTSLIWGTTFVSTKILLTAFSPVEILLFRFVLGYLALFAACPRRFKTSSKGQELIFAAAGLCGVCLYYLLENIALTYTMASNVSVIVSVAPFFTALLTRLLLKGEEKLHPGFLLGFVVAMAGVFLICFNGIELKLNPAGDLLALSAALLWALYSVLIKKITAYGYGTIPATRRIFFYGVLFMLPAALLLGFRLEPARLTSLTYLSNLVYLGLGASALCFVTWNLAVKILGPVKTSVYIYIVPVITIASSALILGDPLTPLTAAGTGLALAGLFLSERRPKEHGPRG